MQTTHCTAKVSGLTRAYFETIDWRMPLPCISDIMNNPDDYIALMYHIAMNHKGLNWKMYHFQLDADTYPVFIYSLAFCAIDLNPCMNYSWQMNRNARKVTKFLNKNDTKLTLPELKILDICSDFSGCMLRKAERISTFSKLVEELHDIYNV